MLENGTEESAVRFHHERSMPAGEEVVGAVIGGGNGVEHLLNVRGGGLFSGDTGGAGSGGAFVFGCAFDCHGTMLVGSKD